MRIAIPVKSSHHAGRGWRSPHPGSEAGFTLIEALASALMVVVIGAAVAQALITGNNFSANQRLRSQAAAVAQADQERLKGLSDEQLAGLVQTRTTTLNGRTFTIVSKGQFIDTTGGSSCMSKIAAYFRLDTTVSWNLPGGGTKSIAIGTILTRPASGSLLVTVKNELASPLPGATVTAKGLTSGSQQSAMTDQNGCALFSGLPGLPVQTYLVTATLGGFVTWDGLDSWPNVTANVNGTGIATPTLNPLILGNAGQASASFFTYRNASPQLVSGFAAPGISYYGQKADKMTTFKTVSTSGVTISTPAKLFPFVNPGTPPDYSNNYQVWAGGCWQEDPASPPAFTGPVPASPSGQADYATVKPGTLGNLPTNQVAVYEPAIDLAVFNKASVNPNPVTPAHVKIIFTADGTDPNAPKCANGTLTETWNVTAVATDTFTGTPYAYGVYPGPFASNSASGQPDAPANGSGQVQICADYPTSSGSRKETAGPLDNATFTGPSQRITMDLVSDSASKSGTC